MGTPLLEGLIDYAGVFPPAELPLPDARDEYLAIMQGPHAWVVGPMLVRASQLDPAVLGGVPRLGIVADAAAHDWDLEQAECRTEPADVAATVAALHDVAPVLYLEAADPDDTSLVHAVAAARADGTDVRAKIRTGGASAAAFPSPATVARFITSCVAASVPFKATAGLHHPVRTPSHVPDATEHGFLNMLAATRCALAGDDEAVLAALRTTDLADFDVTSATWRHVGADLDPGEVRATFRSIGSCSVAEPTGYLEELGML